MRKNWSPKKKKNELEKITESPLNSKYIYLILMHLF